MRLGITDYHFYYRILCPLPGLDSWQIGPARATDSTDLNLPRNASPRCTRRKAQCRSGYCWRRAVSKTFSSSAIWDQVWWVLWRICTTHTPMNRDLLSHAVAALNRRSEFFGLCCRQMRLLRLKTHLFSNRVRIGRSRSSKVVDFGTNRKGICDFLLVINSNFGPILHHFWDTATYC